MKKKHDVILKEITNDLELSMVSGGNGGSGGSGDAGTGIQGIWAAGVSAVTGKSCSYPGGFYSSGSSIPSGGGTCVGGASGLPLWMLKGLSSADDPMLK